MTARVKRELEEPRERAEVVPQVETRANPHGREYLELDVPAQLPATCTAAAATEQ